MSIEVKKVSGKKDLRKFIEFELNHYKNHPFHVPPLIFDEENTFNPKKNPVFEFCDSALFMAYKDGKPVGRIAAIVNNRSNQKFNEKKARFGWIEFIDDPEVSRALLEKVEKWAKDKGQTELIGPMGFTDLDYEGCLTYGFDQIGRAHV